MPRFASSAFLCLSALIMLAGCEYFPTGYAHLNKEYRSPKGEKAEPIGYPYRSYANAAIVEQWRPVASQLVDQLRDELNIQPQQVFVKMLPDQNAFNATFDFAIREELRMRGFSFAKTEGHVLTIEPEALQPVPWTPALMQTDFNDEGKVPLSRISEGWLKNHDGKFLMGLILTRDGVLVGEVKGHHVVPYYGYVNGSSIDRLSHLEDSTPIIDEGMETPEPLSSSAPQNILAPAVPENVTQEPLDAH